MVRLLLVDDHQIIRDAIKQYLSDEPDIRVIGEAANGRDGLRLLETLRPDILVTDLSMPGLNGLDLVREALLIQPDLKTLVFSMHTEEAYIRKAISLGVSGYIPKDATKYELVEALQTIAAGDIYFSDKVSRIMMGGMVKKVRRQDVAVEDAPKLTAREKEVLALIMEGMSSPQIADKLFISNRTVENHRANIMAKLKVRNTIELVRFVLENEYLDL